MRDGTKPIVLQLCGLKCQGLNVAAAALQRSSRALSS